MTPHSCHITNAWHPSSGGVRTFYAALLEQANAAGRRLSLVVPSDRTRTEPVGAHGRIHFLAAPPAPAFDRRYRTLYPHTYLPPWTGALHQLLRREQPDVVEICDKYTLPYLAMLLRKGYLDGVRRPALVGLTAERFDDNMAAYLSRGVAAHRFTRWYLRHIYGPPFDLHLANSAYTARELREAMPERPAGFIRVCSPGVHSAEFSPEHRSPALRARLLGQFGATPAATLLLYAGRLSPEKNLGLLTETVRLLADRGHDLRLLMVGDGPAAPDLRALERGPLAGRLRLHGPAGRAELAALYASADVFVHPNPREPFGIAPLEAMASGIPVVLPDAGGVLTYASAANAWLARPLAAEMAAAILSAARGNSRRRAAALETVHRFAWQVAARRHFEAYDAVHASVRNGERHWGEPPGRGLPARRAPVAGPPCAESQISLCSGSPRTAPPTSAR